MDVKQQQHNNNNNNQNIMTCINVDTTSYQLCPRRIPKVSIVRLCGHNSFVRRISLKVLKGNGWEVYHVTIKSTFLPDWEPLSSVCRLYVHDVATPTTIRNFIIATVTIKRLLVI